MTQTSTHSHRTFAQWAQRYLMNFTLWGVAGILVFLLFFTDTSVQATYHYERQVEQLQQELKNENDSLNYYRSLNRRLATDPNTLEQLARERYHMQRQNEDVYIIESND